jgi:hypothetical protein
LWQEVHHRVLVLGLGAWMELVAQELTILSFGTAASRRPFHHVVQELEQGDVKALDAVVQLELFQYIVHM